MPLACLKNFSNHPGAQERRGRNPAGGPSLATEGAQLSHRSIQQDARGPESTESNGPGNAVSGNAIPPPISAVTGNDSQRDCRSHTQFGQRSH